MVQELKGRCTEYTTDALKNEFEYPTIFQQLRLAIGSEGSQKSHMTLRAQPHSYGTEPWYDFAEVIVKEDRGNGNIVNAHYAAQLLCFVDLTRKSKLGKTTPPLSSSDEEEGEEENKEADEEADSGDDEEPPSAMEEEDDNEEGQSWMLAFVKFHVNALRPSERDNDPAYTWNDLSVLHKTIPLACVHEDPDPIARYGLIDTEQIQQGLWVQKDYQTPDRLWVLKLA